MKKENRKIMQPYLPLPEITEIIQFEVPELFKEFQEVSDERKLYSAQRCTNKIESLGIINNHKKDGELTFPLPYQNSLEFDFKLCIALETLYIALNKVSEEITGAKGGIVSESDKSASATYDPMVVRSLKSCTFNNLKAYELIYKYIPKSYYVR